MSDSPKDRVIASATRAEEVPYHRAVDDDPRRRRRGEQREVQGKNSDHVAGNAEGAGARFVLLGAHSA